MVQIIKLEIQGKQTTTFFDGIYKTGYSKVFSKALNLQYIYVLTYYNTKMPFVNLKYPNVLN